MGLATFEPYAHLSRPLTENDYRNLKRLTSRRELQDVLPVIQHLMEKRLKLEQEAIHLISPTWPELPDQPDC